MVISIKYFGIMNYDLPSEITLEEDSTIKRAVEIVPLDGSDLDTLTFLLNNEPAGIDVGLKDGDTLLILQVLGGG